ncbi:MAG: hypothetical protein OYH77_05720 [Pseudomonadota bacterium]|nr:hypothetical protein [Pseudomonadota bacterium]
MRYLFVLLLISGLGAGISKKAQALSLEQVSAKSLGNRTLLTLDLDRAPHWKTVEIQAQDSYVEFKLPSTTTAAGSKLIEDISSPYVLKIVPMQPNPTTLVLRMYVSEQGQLVQQATHAEISGKHIFISLDHRKLEEILASTKLNNSNTNVKHAGFAEMVRHVGIALATAMAMLLFLLVGMRWMVRDRTTIDSQPTCPMKIIWRLKITAKQKLLLVEVYGQTMLFSSDANGLALLSDSPCPTNPALAQLGDSDGDNLLLNQKNLEAQKTIQRQTSMPAQHQTGVEDMASIMHRKLSNI